MRLGLELSPLTLVLVAVAATIRRVCGGGRVVVSGAGVVSTSPKLTVVLGICYMVVRSHGGMRT